MSDTSVRRVIPALSRLYSPLDPLALPLLRIVTGLLLVPHGAQKLFGWFGGPGLTGMAGWLDSIGYSPGFLFALIAGLIEFVGGLALAFGFLTRVAAASVVALMVVIVFGFHWSAGFFWTDGGWEYPALWAFAALVFAIKGGGALSVDRALGREI